MPPFPPSFLGSPWGYGFALFGDLVATTLCLALLLTYIAEPFRNREINLLLRNPVHQPEIPMWTAGGLYRSFIMALLLVVVLRAGPDTAWMLAWGEVSYKTIDFMIAVDLWFDGAALIPLGFALLCWAWGRQAIPQALASERALVRVGVPTWGFFLHNARLVLLVLLISVGVTIGKAGRGVGLLPLSVVPASDAP